MNRNNQLQKVFDKVKTLDGIGFGLALKLCRDVNGVIDDKTALMTVVHSNCNRNDKNRLSKIKCIVKVLIEHGANVNFQNSSGLTALHIAVSSLTDVIDVEIVQLLLDYGADPNKVDYLGKSPMFHFIDNSSVMPRVLQMFQNHGANFRKKDNEGNTVLHIKWSSETFREFLNLDVDVNAQNNIGETPILRQMYGTVNCSAIEALIQNNANVNMKTKHGVTPLFVACGSNNTDFGVKIAKTLLEAGARVNIQVFCKKEYIFTGVVAFLDGETALHLAIRLKNLPLIQLLVDYHDDWLPKPAYYDSIHSFLLFLLSENDYDQIMCRIEKKIEHQRQKLFSYLRKSWIRKPHHEPKNSISKRLGSITSSLLSVISTPTEFEKRKETLLTSTYAFIIISFALYCFTNRNNKLK